jgi:hypothetical protein
MSNHHSFALTDAGGTVAPRARLPRLLVGRGHWLAVLAGDSAGHAAAADVAPAGSHG